MKNNDVMSRVDGYLKHNFCIMVGDIAELNCETAWAHMFCEVRAVADRHIVTHFCEKLPKADIVAVYRKKGKRLVRVWKKGGKKKLY